MKKLIYILMVVATVVATSCQSDDPKDPSFKDVFNFTIYDYIEDSLGKENYSSFLQILEAGGINKTLSAYNPEGQGYTLFLPDNNAIQEFINESSVFSTLNDLLANKEYAGAFSRYHVVSTAVKSNDFPFGAFSDPTLSGDFLTVSFVIEPDTAYYKINNQASVFRTNIETSNGYIHLVKSALNPVTFTTYQWLGLQPGVSIFKAAVDLTGQQELINVLANDTVQPVTLLIEPDSVFQKSGIHSVEDLAAVISPGNTDYTNPNNPLRNFVAYHVLTGSHFLNNFEGTRATNFTTLSEIPLMIDGTGIDIAINKGKENFDTIVIQGDTTIIDYVSFIYDYSNVITQSGAIHFINQVMKQKSPSRATVTFGFYEDGLLNKFRSEGAGTYLIDEPKALRSITWEGPELFFVDGGDQNNGAWDNDYLEISGDFILKYQLPRIVQGKYMAKIRAERFNTQNAVIEVLVDGKKIGSAVDLTTGGSAGNPFQTVDLGTIDFKRYSGHTIEIRPLIPGRFLWDWIQFEPI